MTSPNGRRKISRIGSAWIFFSAVSFAACGGDGMGVAGSGGSAGAGAAGGGSGGSAGAGGSGGSCGDGVADPGETEIDCCVDVGCSAGVCDLVNMTCVDPWTLECDGATGCGPTRPLYCGGPAMPVYICSSCDCPGSETCNADVCYDPSVLMLEKTTPGVPWDESLDYYFPFYDWLAAQSAMTYADFIATVDAMLREDARRVALIIGESHGSDDEQAVGIGLIRDVHANWPVWAVGIEDNGSPLFDPVELADLNIPTQSIAGGFTNDTYCAALESEIDSKRNDVDGIYAQYTGNGHTSQEVCHHPQHWSICTFPHTGECALRASRKGIVLILFDPKIWASGITDIVLMWRVGNSYPDEAAVTATLAATVARWSTTFGAQKKDPAFDATVHGRAVNVRIMPAANADDTFIAFFPAPGLRPWFVEGWGVLWNDLTIRAEFLAKDIRPSSCSVSYNLGDPGSGPMYYFCNNVEAEVDPSTLTLTSFVIN